MSDNETTRFLQGVALTRHFFEGYDDARHDEFPTIVGTDHKLLLGNVTHYLNESVHGTVMHRAAMIDKGIYLTDHGPRHIEIVIRRASDLLLWSEKKCPLSLLEIFLLILSIHYHDVGNMYGRDGHETRCLKEMSKVPGMDQIDQLKRTIARIALAHGGKIEEEANPLGQLSKKIPLSGKNVRLQAIAAILRLADELADEFSRADNYGLKNPNELPPGCLIFQKYAAALTVDVNAEQGEIGLNYTLHHDDIASPFEKGDQQVYLLDEIYSRTLKTYREAVYCSYYARDVGLNINQVKVKIEVYLSKASLDPEETIAYTLGDIAHFSETGSSVSVKDQLGRFCSGSEKLITGAKLAQLTRV